MSQAVSGSIPKFLSNIKTQETLILFTISFYHFHPSFLFLLVSARVYSQPLSTAHLVKKKTVSRKLN